MADGCSRERSDNATRRLPGCGHTKARSHRAGRPLQFERGAVNHRLLHSHRGADRAVQAGQGAGLAVGTEGQQVNHQRAILGVDEGIDVERRGNLDRRSGRR
jgi:hypothetical protein